MHQEGPEEVSYDTDIGTPSAAAVAAVAAAVAAAGAGAGAVVAGAVVAATAAAPIAAVVFAHLRQLAPARLLELVPPLIPAVVHVLLPVIPSYESPAAASPLPPLRPALANVRDAVAGKPRAVAAVAGGNAVVATIAAAVAAAKAAAAAAVAVAAAVAAVAAPNHAERPSAGHPPHSASSLAFPWERDPPCSEAEETPSRTSRLSGQVSIDSLYVTLYEWLLSRLSYPPEAAINASKLARTADLVCGVLNKIDRANVLSKFTRNPD